MMTIRTAVLTTTLTAAAAVSPALEATGAQASEPSVPADVPQSRITTATVDQAIAEARAHGAITHEKTGRDGARTVTIDDGRGVSLELMQPSAGNNRLSAGTDGHGFWVGFNAFDQNLIISGAAAGIGSGLCALGPAVCAVSTVALTLANVAVSGNGGVRCGTTSLRVYPISQHAPRCA